MFCIETAKEQQRTRLCKRRMQNTLAFPLPFCYNKTDVIAVHILFFASHVKGGVKIKPKTKGDPEP